MSSNPLGTRKNPTRLRLAIIFVVMFVGALLFLSLSSGKASAAPLTSPLAEVDKSEPMTYVPDRTAEKYLLTMAVGCGGGWAAGGPPGLYFGCVGAGLGVAIDWAYSD